MTFPFLFGRAFIEAVGHNKDAHNLGLDFPSFSEGLSLRHEAEAATGALGGDFPSFSEGLSLRRISCAETW